MSWEQSTSGTGLSGSTEGVPTCMALHGLLMLLIVQHLLAAEDYSDLIGGVENVTSYADRIVSTINPAISMDGSNAENAPLPQTKPHVCNKPYSEVEDIKMDLIVLIATCQRHTRCSPAYCLKKKKGVQECRFVIQSLCSPSLQSTWKAAHQHC